MESQLSLQYKPGVGAGLVLVKDMEEMTLPGDERTRLEALWSYQVLDTPPEKDLDDLVHLAAYICHAPIALISLVDVERQWFKSKLGLTVSQTDRIIAFCSHTILTNELLVVTDAHADERFAGNPMVIGDPHIRFYCGAPLITPDGHRIGALSVIDHVPRELSPEQMEALRVLSRQVMEHLTLDRQHRELVASVNARLKAERQLEISEATFRTLSETAASGILVYRGDHILYANRAAEHISGYSRDELSRMSMWALIHADFQAELRARVNALTEDQRSAARLEFQIVQKNGGLRWVDFSAGTIDFEGAPARICTVHDITGAREAEAALRRQAALLDASYDASFAWRLGGPIIYWNRGAERLYGLPATLAVGRVPHDVLRTKFPQGLQPCVDELRDKGSWEGELRHCPADDRPEIIVDSRMTLVREGGQDLVLEVNRDVTARQQADALKEVQRRMLEKISLGVPLSEVMDFVVQSIEALSDGAICTILLIDAEKHTLLRGATSSLPEELCRAIDGAPVGPQNGSCGTAAYRKRLVAVVDIATDPLWAPWKEASHLALHHGLRACTSTPILSAGGELFGTFAMYFRTARGPTVQEAELLRVSGQMLGIALQQARRDAVLRESEQRFSLVALATNDVLWDWDLTTHAHWWSPNARLKFGYDPEFEPEIEAWRSRLHPDDRGRILAGVDEALTGGATSWIGEYQFRLADGSYGNFLDRGHIVRDATGKAVRMIGAMIDVTEMKRTYQALVDAHERLQHLSRETHLTESRERAVLARELHDEFGQLLTAAKLNASWLKSVNLTDMSAAGRSQFTDKAEDLVKVLDDAIRGIRQVATRLRPAVLDHLGLIPAIESLVETFEKRTGVPCHVSIEQAVRTMTFDADERVTLYRITQELLTNVVKHAQATSVALGLTVDGDRVVLDVQDNGRGLGPAEPEHAGAWGLKGIRERTELLGGSLDVQSHPGKGTRIRVVLPMRGLKRNANPGATRSAAT